jgi:spermidine/putrescine transport system substrate-binding protein
VSQDERRIVDPALLRGLTMPRITRRAALRGAGVAGMSALLAACGVKGTTKSAPPPDQAKLFWDKQVKAGVLNFANWPAYIDTDPVNGKTSLQRFTDATGIKVNYKEVIQDNDSFLGKITPSLRAGQDTGWDLMVITNGGSIEKLIRQNFLQQLDLSRLPNFNKYASAQFKNPSYDPGNKHTVAWQAGITGIGYNPKLTGREITTFEDLFDPKFKGRVGMFGDNVDLPNFTMVGMGIKPETSTVEDWRRAADKLKRQRDSGILRKYIDNAQEIQGLESGDLWASMAYSGDIFQINAELEKAGKAGEIKFVIPKEGAMLWTDNMCIPLKAKHPLDALTYMDYVYQPSIAAQLAAFIEYITPVQEAAKLEMQRQIPTASRDQKDTLEAAVKDPLIFPTEADLARTHRYRVLTLAEEKVWNSIFEPIVQS